MLAACCYILFAFMRACFVGYDKSNEQKVLEQKILKCHVGHHNQMDKGC